MTLDQLNPPTRLLMGPGPINADPRVARATASALTGQFDPWMTATMNETMGLYRSVFSTANEQTFLVDGTSRAAIEAALVSLVSPGQTVLVAVMGRFGLLLKEIAERAGAQVVTIERPWGTVFTLDEIEEGLRTHRPDVFATVQGDTATTMNQPLDGLGQLCHRYGALCYVDATASVAGNTLLVDEWGLDVVSAGLQKCLGGPSGSAPITISERAREVISSRRHVEAGITEGAEGLGERIRSNYLDLAMLMDYWGPRRLNHHTESGPMLYAARECARIIADEGIANTVERHRLHGAAMAAGLAGLGLELFGDQTHRMNNVIGVKIPDDVGGDALRAALLEDFAIEIGTSFGPLAGVVWRVGVMGYNARRDAVLTTLAALEAELRRFGHPTPAGGGLTAAMSYYQEQES
ncbi:Aminotransferase class V [Acidipropionibacterium acidipropionici ATCC 4875]|jgi:(S)-ureidoglycine-glyoxylate aminotransferase|uniref:Aminotransferase class V n=1 Tax=Acidipropionibacterium acidipropionici (strain ATCC 4875 / DSM 20272 / JCM 6432 / NBRC 12425 / NCIMB 8070 / 4) TaxID=1171373 RepID=K7RKH7_ACIA4|nr:alanine--glyoxylate aminotransferase family protein [Acidipropionibacterium acidipropionici]AFV88399.1 Aminotransferase class V [Acidipropionibacterium acidipropionici ATCC 4875]